MIVRMGFEDIGLVGIKTNYNEKEKTHYIRYVVDEYSIDRAIKVIKGNKWVVALDYDGDYQYLFEIPEDNRPKVPIIVTKEFSEINELSISFFMNNIPDWVRVSIKTPPDFSDMRMIETLSKKFPNICFCGGKFLRLPGCCIGCIQREDLPYKIADSKIPYRTDGCACVLITLDEDKVEGKVLLFKETDLDGNDNKESKSVKKEPVKEKVKDILENTPKKARVSSIEDLFKQ